MQDHQTGHRDGEGRDFIEQVRRSEYMIGMTLSVEAEEAAEGMRRKLNNALRLLSDDLYSTKTHFVLELIQNADDNTYADGIGPEIHLVLSSSALKIWNNEQGFTQADVRALCSVGESTKSKKVGFIGEKGIGFKSVFQVSNAPQIHSNGFHFRFDMSNPEEHLGYVVSHWIEPNASIAADGTTIVLLAKTGESFTDAVLSELDARLLLFLRKLTRIELRTPSGEVTMRRLDEAGLVTLQTDRRMQASEVVSSSQRYLRVSSNVSMTDAVDEKRPAVVDSEIILAFPVDDAGKALAAPDCATFAFLPIRTFGFRFCVQADFLLSSAREDIAIAIAPQCSKFEVPSALQQPRLEHLDDLAGMYGDRLLEEYADPMVIELAQAGKSLNQDFPLLPGDDLRGNRVVMCKPHEELVRRLRASAEVCGESPRF